MPEPSREPLVRYSAQLLGHREALLPQPALRGRDRHVKRVGEVGPSERDDEREAQAGPVQLVYGNDDEGPWLCLLGSPCGIGVSPEDIALLWRGAYHSGAGAAKPTSTSRASAR